MERKEKKREKSEMKGNRISVSHSVVADSLQPHGL